MSGLPWVWGEPVDPAHDESTPMSQALASPQALAITPPAATAQTSAARAVTRSVEVAAPADEVFLWLCQLRRAPYSYDWIDNFGGKSPQRADPRMTQLAVGQTFMTIFTLTAFTPGKSVTLRMKDGGPTAVFGAITLTYSAVPINATRSRLNVVMWLPPIGRVLGRTRRQLLAWGDLVMMRKQLLTIARYANESHRAAATSARAPASTATRAPATTVTRAAASAESSGDVPITGDDHRVVVLGAGYTGLTAARRAARRLRRLPVTVTLVAPDDAFVERIRMHQVAAGQDLRSVRLRDLLSGTGVRLRQARVTDLDLDRQTVTLAGADGTEQLSFDTLVCATGSGRRHDDLPGAAEHGHSIAGRADALELKGALDRLPDGRTVTVIGGGLTGLEAAAEIAESRRGLRVRLLPGGTLGSWLSPAGRRHVRAVCDRLGIDVLEDDRASAVGDGWVTTGAGRRLRTDVTVCTTGFAVDGLAAAAGLRTAPTGRVVVDDDMRSVSHPAVYAIGDVAHAIGPGGSPLRMSCASGIPTAWRAADALAAVLGARRRPRLPLGYVFQCVSLGRGDGLIQFVRADDRPLGVVLTGRVAAVCKEVVCRGAAVSAAGRGYVTGSWSLASAVRRSQSRTSGHRVSRRPRRKNPAWPIAGTPPC